MRYPSILFYLMHLFRSILSEKYGENCLNGVQFWRSLDIMPKKRVSCCRQVLETIVNVSSLSRNGKRLVAISTRKKPVRNDNTRWEFKYICYIKFFLFFVAFNGTWNFSVLFDLFNRATNLALTCNIDVRIRHNYAKAAIAPCRIGLGRSLREGPVQIRIGLDQNTADGPDKLLDLWIVDGANVDLLNPPCYRQNLRSFREEKEKQERNKEKPTK